MRPVTIFWGCTIPARLPFIEKATRLVLAELGVAVTDPSGFTCCPETQLVRTLDEHAFYLTAARNLSVAAANGAPLVTPCSGCYSTFKQTLSLLKKDWRLARRIGEKLAQNGRRLELSVPVWHLAEWLCDEIGAASLRRRVRRPLWGMKLAVHYGCHLLRPSPSVRWDNPLAPTKLEELLRNLGALVVDYSNKMLCCGNALERAGHREPSQELVQLKLTELRDLDVDGLVVACPACFLQFDLNQARERSELGSIPVFYVAELVALALGHEPQEIGIDLHRTSASAFLTQWAQKLEARKALAEHFDLSILETCATCGACDQDCPVATTGCGFRPLHAVHTLLDGRLEEVLAAPDPWQCLDCMTCVEKCHSGFGLAWMFEKLRHLAALRGNSPSSLRIGYQEFISRGTLGVSRPQIREKLGLPPLPQNGASEIRQLLSQTDGETEQ
ncbi:MAG: heterodisulfide reductase-related iron-sulfur binding cluster [Thermoleophilia bacterium]|nr:heterodisulfide reductase-related iron-sulfur binding cluster [Thermoleophilia bacterium]